MSRITHRRSGIRRDSIDEESIALDLTSDEYSCSENEHTADDDAVSHSSEYTYETYTVTESVNTSSAASVISSGVNKVEEVGKGKGHSAEDIEEIEEAQSNIQCEDNLNEVPVAEQRHFLNDIDKLSSLTSSQKNNNAVPPRSTTLNESKKVKEGTDTVLDNISSLKRKQEAMALIPATEQTTIKSNRNEYVQLTAKNAAISTVAEQSKTEVDKNKGLEAKSNTFAAHYSKKCHSRLSKQLHKHDIEKGVSLPIAASKQGHSSINPRIHAASTSIHCRQSASSNDCGARNHYAFLSFSKSRIYKSNSSIPNGIFTARKSSRLFPVETLEFQRNNTHIATGIFTSQRSFSTRANGIFTARKLNNNNFKYTSIKDLLKGQPSSLTASRKDRVRQHVNSNIGNKQSNSESHKGNMNSWHKLKDEGCGKTAEITTFAAASQKQGSNHAVHSPAISDEINEQKKATASLATNSEHNSPPTSTKANVCWSMPLDDEAVVLERWNQFIQTKKEREQNNNSSCHRRSDRNDGMTKVQHVDSIISSDSTANLSRPSNSSIMKTAAEIKPQPDTNTSRSADQIIDRNVAYDNAIFVNNENDGNTHTAGSTHSKLQTSNYDTATKKTMEKELENTTHSTKTEENEHIPWWEKPEYKNSSITQKVERDGWTPELTIASKSINEEFIPRYEDTTSAIARSPSTEYTLIASKREQRRTDNDSAVHALKVPAAHNDKLSFSETNSDQQLNSSQHILNEKAATEIQHGAAIKEQPISISSSNKSSMIIDTADAEDAASQDTSTIRKEPLAHKINDTSASNDTIDTPSTTELLAENVDDTRATNINNNVNDNTVSISSYNSLSLITRPSNAPNFIPIPLNRISPLFSTVNEQFYSHRGEEDDLDIEIIIESEESEWAQEEVLGMKPAEYRNHKRNHRSISNTTSTSITSTRTYSNNTNQQSSYHPSPQTIATTATVPMSLQIPSTAPAPTTNSAQYTAVPYEVNGMVYYGYHPANYNNNYYIYQ